MEEQQNQDRTDFLRETIKQRPLNRKKLIRKTIITAAMAVIFGLVACLTFLLLEPVISNRLYPEEKPSTVVLVEEKESEEILPEDMIADDSEMSPEPVTPVLEDEQIAQLLSEMKLGVEDYILKPVAPDEFKNTMLKVISELEMCIRDSRCVL